MMPYSNKKVKIRSTDRDTDFFDIVAGVLQSGYICFISIRILPRLRVVYLR